MYFVFFNEHYIPYKPQIRIHLVLFLRGTLFYNLLFSQK